MRHISARLVRQHTSFSAFSRHICRTQLALIFLCRLLLTTIIEDATEILCRCPECLRLFTTYSSSSHIPHYHSMRGSLVSIYCQRFISPFGLVSSFFCRFQARPRRHLAFVEIFRRMMMLPSRAFRPMMMISLLFGPSRLLFIILIFDGLQDIEEVVCLCLLMQNAYFEMMIILMIFSLLR